MTAHAPRMERVDPGGNGLLVRLVMTGAAGGIGLGGIFYLVAGRTTLDPFIIHVGMTGLATGMDRVPESGHFGVALRLVTIRAVSGIRLGIRVVVTIGAIRAVVLGMGVVFEKQTLEFGVMASGAVFFVRKRSRMSLDEFLIKFQGVTGLAAKRFIGPLGAFMVAGFTGHLVVPVMGDVGKDDLAALGVEKDTDGRFLRRGGPQVSRDGYDRQDNGNGGNRGVSFLQRTNPSTLID